jgi:hypothetical protein
LRAERDLAERMEGERMIEGRYDRRTIDAILVGGLVAHPGSCTTASPT